MNLQIGWTTPDDIRNQIERQWSSGRLLTARLRGESLFPYVLSFKKPGAADLAQRFDEVRAWIRELDNASKQRTGFGYEIEWAIRNHRQLGRNRFPTRIVVPTESDALQLLNECDRAEGFQRLVEASLKVFPNLEVWLARRPLTALEHTNDWDRILAVLAWFRCNPASDLYLRQIDIPGVDTKFIEERRGLLTELLDVLHSSELQDEQSVNTKNIEQRFGLRSKPLLIRFRLLDARLYIAGLSDLTIPAADFSRLAPNATTVFITENDVNGLAFPDVPASLVIFGLGYGLERLGLATWLSERRLVYWGDIDTHGFVMLDRLRAIFPDVKSFLMDRETLMLHRASWVREDEPYNGPLDRLTAGERALFDDLRNNNFGPNVRLEQERISFSWVRLALQQLNIAS